MEKVRQAAYLSIGRAVGFAGLAIFTVMIGLSFQPVLALKSGGVLLLLLMAVLLLKAQRTAFTDYRRTEAWLLLDGPDRPDAHFAGQAMRGALRDACLWFARWTAGIAILVWAGAVILALTGTADAS
jgi:uncharacterized membrane protein YdfJ with MMPL/SSD domain